MAEFIHRSLKAQKYESVGIPKRTRRPWNAIAGLPSGVGVWRVSNGRKDYWKVRLGKRFTGKNVIVKYFNSMADAKTWLFGSDYTKTVSKNGVLYLTHNAQAAVGQLTASKILAAAAAYNMLGEASLTDAVEFYLKHARPEGGVKTFNDLLQFYLHRKKAKGVSPNHLAGVRSIGENFARKFGKKPVSLIEQMAVEKWINKLKLEPVTIGNYIRNLRSIFRQAQKRGWCTSNPFTNVETPRVNSKEIACLTPKEVARLFVHCPSDFRPLLALKIFAGLRISELLQLDWRQIRKEEVIVQAQQSKTRGRRVITIQPNLARWLALAKPEEGPLWKKCQKAFHNAIVRIATAAEVKLESNHFRKTFGSYHYAKFKNENLTAAEMGNSPKVIFGH
ncbi:MAG: tyrosine-type recombinase/integrase [Verrucomicrobiota bacterium]